MSNTYWEWHRCRWLMTGSRRIYDDGETLKWVVVCVCVCVSRLTLTKKIKCIKVTLGWFKRDKFLLLFWYLDNGEKSSRTSTFQRQIQFNYYPFCVCVCQRISAQKYWKKEPNLYEYIDDDDQKCNNIIFSVKPQPAGYIYVFCGGVNIQNDTDTYTTMQYTFNLF